MGQPTLAHRATHPFVRALIGTPITPNHLTALRLVTGLLAAGLFALGSMAWAGCWFVLSAFLDRADGELARLSGRTSRSGHYFDLGSDICVTVLLFIGIGIGLRQGSLGNLAVWLGLVAGASVALIFLSVIQLESRKAPEESPGAPFDPDDTLFLVGPLAWLGWLQPFLLLAAAGAPLFLAWSLLQLRAARAQPGMP